MSGLTLTPGLKYSLRVAAVNHAGGVATYDTNGVLVDPTAPVVSVLVCMGVMDVLLFCFFLEGGGGKGRVPLTNEWNVISSVQWEALIHCFLVYCFPKCCFLIRLFPFCGQNLCVFQPMSYCHFMTQQAHAW